MTSKTAQEKAQDLVNKYYNLESEGDKGGWMTLNDAKQCALITVTEILKQFIWKPSTGMSYWQKVEQEIKKL